MTAIAEAPRKSAARKPRRGNRRPKLLAPRLQTLFALPPQLLLSRAWRRLGRRETSPKSQPHPDCQPGEHAAATEKRLDKRWVFHFHLPQR